MPRNAPYAGTRAQEKLGLRKNSYSEDDVLTKVCAGRGLTT